MNQCLAIPVLKIVEYPNAGTDPFQEIIFYYLATVPFDPFGRVLDHADLVPVRDSTHGPFRRGKVFPPVGIPFDA